MEVVFHILFYLLDIKFILSTFIRYKDVLTFLVYISLREILSLLPHKSGGF